MLFSTTEIFFLFCQFVDFSQQWLLHFFLFGRPYLNTSDFGCLSRSFQHGTKQPGSTRCHGCNLSVKLYPYNEKEPDIWFRLIEAQFAAAGIRSQRFKYTNALASLPKQVLRDILDTIDVCNDSDQPFDHFKEVLLGQF
jgi:hypothetical protein